MGKYRNYTDGELVILAANGDSEAVAELLQVRYRETLVAAARNVNAKFSNDDIDDVIQNFTIRNITPDTKGQWRLRDIAAGSNPMAYIVTSFKNYIRDEFRKEKIDIVTSAPDEGRTGDDDENRHNFDTPEPLDDSYDDMHPMTQKELQIAAIFEALSSLGDLKPYERYILVTFLLGERFRGDGAKPLKIRERLAEQLEVNPSTVYNKYADLKADLTRKAKEYLARLRGE